MSGRVRQAITFLSIVVLLIAAAALRFQDLNWDEYQHVHPDERFIVWVADTMSWPGSIETALNPERSTLDPFRWPPDGGDLAGQPRGYAYGHFPLYLLVGVAHSAQAVAEWMGSTTIAFPAALQPLYTVGRHLAEYDYLPLVGRAISALCDLATLVLVFALGRRAFGRAAGLIAAGFYTIAVLPIQLGHFYAVDLLLTLCVVASVALAARWAEQGGWATWIAAGIAAGLAVGSKFSAMMLAAPLLAAALCRLPSGSSWRKAAVVAGRLSMGGAAGLLAFVVTNPFAFIEARAFLSNIVLQQAMANGTWDVPYTRQYVGTLPYVYFVQQLSQWGLGWPLGLVAWGGLVWLTVQAVRRRATSAQLIILAWVLPYMAYTGGFYAKFLRYMAPVVPFLLICGAGAAIAAWRWMAARWGRRGQFVFGVVAAVIVLTTAGWVMAFSSIYRQEHPWIQASRWIYENVPAGSKILTEHWDDALPLRLDGVADRPSPKEYQGVELPLYDPDTPEKLETLISNLSSGDYLVLASNRLYAPISRIPGRYPMTSQYYRLLFAGDLGYRKVAEFSSYPTLGGITVRDDSADESFTVYDHPRTMVFANVERLKPGLLRSRLERYLPMKQQGQAGAASQGVPDPPRTAARLPGHASFSSLVDPGPEANSLTGGADLGLDEPVQPSAGLADFRWNRLASEWPPAAIFAWWLVLSLFGWLAWPLVFPAMRGLTDRGFGLARGVGWLLIGWTHWVGVSLGAWQNRTWAIGLVAAFWGAVAIVAWRRQRMSMATFWAAHRRLILAEEAVFGVAFLAFVGIRLLNPDLWQPWNGGEKFMESAFINATLRSPTFPPYDPYFAGGFINYYYYGLYLVTLPMKLTGIAPEVAFNLATSSLAAVAAVVLVSVGASLSRSADSTGQNERPGIIGAFLGMAMALLMGNLAALRATLRSLKAMGEGLGAAGRFLSGAAYDYWAPSRVIPFTINEFPLWTFVFADLHPHLIAIPFGLLVVGLSFNWLRSSEPLSVPRIPSADAGELGQGSGSHQSAATCDWRCLGSQILLLALSLGAMGAINTWDLPTYALLVLAALMLTGWRRRRIKPIVGNALAALLIWLLAVAAYWPFYAHYHPPVVRDTGSLLQGYLGLTHQGSPLDGWLLVWGIFLFLAYALALFEFFRDAPQPRAQRASAQVPGAIVDARTSRSRVVGLLIVLALGALLASLQRPAAALAAVPLSLIILVVLRRWLSPEQAFLGVLLAIGLGILAGLEVLYVRDFLDGGEWYRMNTVFKFSLPAWLFIGLALGVWLGRRWEDSVREGTDGAGARQGLWGAFWRLMVIVALIAGSSFLIFGVQARVRDRFPGQRPEIGTLDGTAYMTVGKYTWPDANHVIDLAYEYQAIHWMLDHLQGAPVVAEAPAGGYQVAGTFQAYDYYRAGGLRVASLTGFPTFLGQHQTEQRAGEQVAERASLGQEFFQTLQVERTKEIARELGVRYVYVGALERVLFSADSLAKFDAMAKRGELRIAYRNPQVTLYEFTSNGQ